MALWATLLLWCGLFLCAVSVARAEHPIVGKVSLAVGGIHRIAADGQRVLVKQGDALREMDRIVTSANALAVILFADQARLALRPDSDVLIKAYRIDPSGAATQLDLELLKGTVRQISGRGAQLQPERYRLNTPIAAIGVRGTDFLASNEAGTVRTYVHEGTIVIQPPASDCPRLSGCPVWAASNAGDAGALLQIQAGGQIRRLSVDTDEVERIFGVRVASARAASARTTVAQPPSGVGSTHANLSNGGTGPAGNTTAAAGPPASAGSDVTPPPAAAAAMPAAAEPSTGSAPIIANNSGGASPALTTGPHFGSLASLSRNSSLVASVVQGAGSSASSATSGAVNPVSPDGGPAGVGSTGSGGSGAVSAGSAGSGAAPGAVASTNLAGGSIGAGGPGTASEPTIPSASIAAPPALLPLPKGLVWAASSIPAPASASGLNSSAFPLLVPTSLAMVNRQVTVGEIGLYNLWRDATTVTFPAYSGQFSFGLAAAQVLYIPPAGAAAAADVSQARLDVNFSAATFSTYLRLGGGAAPLSELLVTGQITAIGLLRGQSVATGQSVSGAISLDGREAGYSFKASSEAGLFQGITLWGLAEGVTRPPIATPVTAAVPAASTAASGPALSPGLQAQLLPLPTQLVWGRSTFAPVTSPYTLPLPYEQASVGRIVTVGEIGEYALWRAGGFSMAMGLKGEFTFGLSTAQVFFTPAGAAAQIATVQQASLTANFSTATFLTRLALGGGAVPTATLEAAGRINDQGIFTSLKADGSQSVAGAFTINGQEAGYLFRLAAQGGQFQGITLWGRRP